MTWALYGLSAGIIWGISNVFDKFLFDKQLDNPWYILLVGQLFNLLVGGAILLATPITLNDLPWWTVFLAAALNMIGQICYMAALKFADVSQVVPLFIAGLFTIPLGDALFLGNVLSLTQYCAIVLVGIGGLVLLYDKKKGLTHNWRVLVLMAISICAFSAFWLLGDVVVEYITATQYIAISFVIGTLWVPPFLLLYWGTVATKQRTKRLVAFSSYLVPTVIVFIAISSQLGTLGKIFFSAGLASGGTASLVEATTMGQHIFVFVASLILAKRFPQHFSENIEPNVIIQKAASIGIMIIGGLLILFS